MLREASDIVKPPDGHDGQYYNIMEPGESPTRGLVAKVSGWVGLLGPGSPVHPAHVTEHEHEKIGLFSSVAISGNDVLASVLYTAGGSIAVVRDRGGMRSMLPLVTPPPPLAGGPAGPCHPTASVTIAVGPAVCVW